MTLEAGAATRDISPAQAVPLGGYPHVPRISTGIHDPLLASALFLRNNRSAVVLCALDLLMLNCDVARRFRRRVAEALGLAESGILISCTHTHSAPVTMHYLPWRDDPALPPPDPAYLGVVETRLVEAARVAQQTAQPAELAWAQADARGIGGNRHSAGGPTDPQAGILAVRVAGRLRAVTLIYGMHPTVLHEDSTLVSSDFPHYARRHLQEALGHELIVLYHNGPAGDQSPRHFVTGQTFAEAERLGRRLGAIALSSLQDLDFTRDAPLAASLQTVELPRRPLPSVAVAQKELAAAQSRYEQLKSAGAARGQVRTAEVAVFGAEGALTLARAQQSGELDRLLAAYRPFEVQTLRIGNACVVGFPGELFAEYGLRLKELAPAKAFVIAYANGELQGYIVTPDAAVAGGYEAASSLFDPQAGILLADAGLAAISRLMPESTTRLPV